MGFLKSIGKAIGGAAKSVGKVAGNVFKSTVGKVASKALDFIPGLKGAGLIGKALSILGKGGSIQNWIKTGLKLFQGLTRGLGLGDSVQKLLSGKFQPLGELSKMLGGALNPLKKASDFLKALQPRLPGLQDALGLAKQLPRFPGNLPLPKQFLPPGLSELNRGLGSPGDAFLKQMGNLPSRAQLIAGMLQEVLRNLEKSTLGGPGPFIRA
jgi:hypothetical protein